MSHMKNGNPESSFLGFRRIHGLDVLAIWSSDKTIRLNNIKITSTPYQPQATSLVYSYFSILMIHSQEVRVVAH